MRNRAGAEPRRVRRAAALFEARGRLGGRVLSVASPGSGLAMDLGATWFWPDSQPLLKEMIADLELIDMPQYDDGSVLHLNDPDKAPERVDGKRFIKAPIVSRAAWRNSSMRSRSGCRPA